MKIVRLLALALAFALLAGACAGDGGGEDSNDAAPAGEETETASDEFCESVVAAETAVLAASSGGDPGDLEGLLETVESSVPAELETQIATVLAAVDEAMTTGDDSAFQTEEFSSSDEEIDQWVSDNCGFEAVDVTAVDYAFEGVPETLPAGVTTFNFSNEGDEVHEMLMVRYKDESTTIEDLMKLSDKEAQKKIVFLGASFGPPGATDTESKDLEPGKYALVCFVPVGSTSEKASRKADGPPHVARGMSAEFVVE